MIPKVILVIYSNFIERRMSLISWAVIFFLGNCRDVLFFNSCFIFFIYYYLSLRLSFSSILMPIFSYNKASNFIRFSVSAAIFPSNILIWFLFSVIQASNYLVIFRYFSYISSSNFLITLFNFYLYLFFIVLVFSLCWWYVIDSKGYSGELEIIFWHF